MLRRKTYGYLIEQLPSIFSKYKLKQLDSHRINEDNSESLNQKYIGLVY